VLLLIASFGALSGSTCCSTAPFAAVIQIIVYAGAIMVLFLFVVMMLLNAPHEDTEYDEVPPAAAAGAAALRRAARVGAGLRAGVGAHARRRRVGPFAGGAVSSVAAIGRSLFQDYSFQFEVTSVLILAAMVGAVVLASRGPAGDGR
jgi:NADH-quinone oxidoreductase subunit J